MNKNGKTPARCKVTVFITSPLQTAYGPDCSVKGLAKSVHLCYSCPNDDSFLPLGLNSHEAFTAIAQLLVSFLLGLKAHMHIKFIFLIFFFIPEPLSCSCDCKHRYKPEH